MTALPVIQSEDCLVLSIWSPSKGNGRKTASKPGLKPVMFWIHGGSLRIGSIFTPTGDGSVLSTQDMVVVFTNYRVGPFGWLYGGTENEPGNLGLYDQLLALKWVLNLNHESNKVFK